ncbi:MAG: YraN family protein [Lachnospiraceae bacterium]|nr:YraN family protein [Lachnospiraceae bacterium]
MNTREIGTAQEQKAVAYLREHGVQILQQNFRCRQGEIDIIGRHDGYLVFVEVKYRKNTNCGTAAEAVTYTKQCRICRVADFYRYRCHYGADTAVRYDVLAIQGEELTWIQNAFPHRYK